jgi:hypothetical protein
MIPMGPKETHFPSPPDVPLSVQFESKNHTNSSLETSGLSEGSQGENEAMLAIMTFFLQSISYNVIHILGSKDKISVTFQEFFLLENEIEQVK